MGEASNFCFQIGRPNSDGMTTLHCTKARRAERIPTLVMRVNGAYGRVEEQHTHGYDIPSGQILELSELAMISDVPAPRELQQRGNRPEPASVPTPSMSDSVRAIRGGLRWSVEYGAVRVARECLWRAERLPRLQEAADDQPSFSRSWEVGRRFTRVYFVASRRRWLVAVCPSSLPGIPSSRAADRCGSSGHLGSAPGFAVAEHREHRSSSACTSIRWWRLRPRPSRSARRAAPGQRA